MYSGVSTVRRRRRISIQQLKAKVHYLKNEQAYMFEQIMALEQQKLHNEARIRHNSCHLAALAKDQDEQHYEIHLLQKEVGKLCAIPTIFEKSAQLVIQQLNQLEIGTDMQQK